MKEYFSILGFKIEKTTSFTSLAAFVLAIWAAAYTVVSFMQGPRLDLIQPEAIVAYKDYCEHQRHPTVAFVVRVSVINSAPKDYASVLHDFRLRFNDGSGDGKIYEFYAEKFAQFGDATDAKKGRVGCENEEYDDAIYYVETSSFTNDVLVEGSSLFSSELLFLPFVPPCENGQMSCYSQNYLEYEKFVELVKRNSQNVVSKLPFTIHILHDYSNSQQKGCSVHTNQSVVWALEEFMHFDVNCVERLSL
ncbi:MAG: hypothetical protein ABJL67_15960 [Sulfitobacter sp.]